MAESIDEYYIVWGSDRVAYGPVGRDTLASWIEDGRVTADSWVFAGNSGSWQKAKRVAELKPLLGISGDTTRLVTRPAIDPQLLRGVKILAGLSDRQLERFARRVEIEPVPEGALIVSQGQVEESMYLILEGEVKVCLLVLGQDVTVTTLQAGDFFGDVALLNHGTRSANVVANTPCLLARLSAAALDQIASGEIDVAAPFFHALDQALGERIRADNQRYSDIMRSALQTP